jgi:hypothetical protein
MRLAQRNWKITYLFGNKIRNKKDKWWGGPLNDGWGSGWERKEGDDGFEEEEEEEKEVSCRGEWKVRNSYIFVQWTETRKRTSGFILLSAGRT